MWKKRTLHIDLQKEYKNNSQYAMWSDILKQNKLVQLNILTKKNERYPVID